MYGKSNTGPAVQQWRRGDRVMYAVRGRDYGQRGTVTGAPRDPDASEVGHVWVRWDDGTSNYNDPGNLDRA